MSISSSATKRQSGSISPGTYQQGCASKITHTCSGVPLSHHSSPELPPAALPMGNGHKAGGFQRVVRKAEGCARGSFHESTACGRGDAAGGKDLPFSSFAGGFSAERVFGASVGTVGSVVARWFHMRTKLTVSWQRRLSASNCECSGRNMRTPGAERRRITASNRSLIGRNNTPAVR